MKKNKKWLHLGVMWLSKILPCYFHFLSESIQNKMRLGGQAFFFIYGISTHLLQAKASYTILQEEVQNFRIF
jgi:hypothetical protein